VAVQGSFLRARKLSLSGATFISLQGQHQHRAVMETINCEALNSVKGVTAMERYPSVSMATEHSMSIGTTSLLKLLAPDFSSDFQIFSTLAVSRVPALVQAVAK